MDPQIVAVAALYFLVTMGLGFWVARREKNHPDDFFLAGRKLPWYAVALSMTGSNIGTEHFIGMVGTAYAFGLAPATFEWGNFIPYSILLWIFLPFFFRKKLYTIPQFLEMRFNGTTRSIFSILTMIHMVFVVLAPALYAGGRIVFEMALQRPVEGFTWPYFGCICLISGATAGYCIYGGLLSVVWTDVLQVLVLVVGGGMLLAFGLNDVGGLQAAIDANLEAGADRFSLILPANHPVSPWTGVATFWFTLSLWYVGTNQFYIQRCLGAKSEWDAKMGVIGCAFIKLFLPLIIVFPGIVAFAKYGPGIARDAVYVRMINDLLPPVGRGILLAALIAAIMSTVSSVLNSAATIWSIDVHRRHLDKNASPEKLVSVGRWATFIIILIGTAFAPLLIWWEGGIFIYIQDMAAFLAPPICVVFLAAFLWRPAHGKAASFTLVFGILSGIAIKILAESIPVENLKPLLNRAALNWGLCLVALMVSTKLMRKGDNESYDKDIIWNAEWARLPQEEKNRNRGGRNLMLWWIVMVVLSSALFIIFR